MKLAVSKDYKRDLKKITPELLSSAEFSEVLHYLHSQKTLPIQYKDHALTGNWQGFRDCHIKNDLVLIYQITDEQLTLIRMGTHSELFG